MENFKLLKFIFMSLYAAGVTGASFYYFFKLTFSAVPESNANFANLILGFLIGTAISTFLGYFYGSSQSASAAVVGDISKGLSKVDEAAIEAAKTKAVAIVEMAKTKEASSHV